MIKTLQAKIVVSFVVFIILPVLLSGYTIMTTLKEAQMAQLDIIHIQLAKRVASEFESYITHSVSQMRNSTDLGGLVTDKKTPLADKLLSLLMYNANFEKLTMLDSEGVELGSIHKYKVIEESTSISYSSKIEYLFPKLNRDIYYGDIHFSPETGEPLMPVSFDLRDPKTGILKGVLIGSLRLKPIWNMLANINLLKGQDIYILDNKYRLVAHPNPSMVLRNVIHRPSEEHLGIGLKGHDAYSRNFVTNFGNQFFTVVAEQHLDEALGTYTKISIIVITVTLSTILMSVMLIIFNLKHIVKPINHLSKVAKEIEQGNLEQKAVVYHEDEIGDMAHAFNKMTKKLKDNNLQLKEFNLGLQSKIKAEIEKSRKMEQLLFEQKKFADMGQMINAIAHQWRQPLNNIGLIQQYLYDGFINGNISISEYKAYSGDMLEIVKNMSATIDDFRTFFTTNKVKERFNVIASIKDFMKLTTAQLNNNNISYIIRCHCCKDEHVYNPNNMNIQCGNDNMEVIGYSGEFKQVLQNIIMNSKDAFAEKLTPKPEIVIEIAHAGENIQLRFRDNAGGIPEEIMQNIFDPYFTTKDEGKGTGIGLYISKIIIDDHFGGRLFARNVNGGAEFVINIPKAPQGEEEADPQEAIS